MKRRELFSSLASSFTKKEEKLEKFIRPPYYRIESDFTTLCIQCREKNCIYACDEEIIELREDSTPILNFANNGCTYCDDCAKACPLDVLSLENKKQINAKFSIDLLKCMSWNQTMCFSCKDPCLDDAIEFLGMFRPQIDENLCTSCGFCLKVCPTDAITLEIIDNN